MKIKETYTLEELCNGLTITLTKFCQMSGITEATLIRLRKGFPGRRVTINKLLETFSKVYGIDFSLENVEGLLLQEQPHQKGKSPSVLTLPIDATPKQEVPQNLIVEPKRTYSPRKTDLPDGGILATDFGLRHGVKRETFRDHMRIGLGPGLIHGDDVPEDGTVQVKDYVRYEERNKRVKKDGTIEKEKYLTQEQQIGAILFWKRHDVVYSQCDRDDCPCHNT